MSINVSDTLPTATAAGVTEYGTKDNFNGRIPFVIRERISPAGGASGSPTDFTQKLPANALVEQFRIKAIGAHTIATATHVSIGTDGDPDAFAEIAEGSVDGDGESVAGVSEGYNAAVATSAEDTLRITATDGSGAAAGTLTGSYDIQLWGWIIQDFAD